MYPPEVKPDVGADLLVYTPEEFEQIRERGFFRHALADAVVLYEAPGALPGSIPVEIFSERDAGEAIVAARRIIAAVQQQLT